MSEDEMKRREFLRRAAAGAGALALGPTGALAAMKGTEIPTVKLGRTGVKISRLVLGTAHPINLPYLKRAVDLGVTAFDLADCYNGGNSERVVGTFMEKTGLRDKLFLTTKSCPHQLEAATRTLDESLERLKSDSVDLFFLHNMKDPDQLDANLKRRVEALKRVGKIKFFGFSTHAPRLTETLKRAAAVGWVDAILFKYNFRDYGDDELNRAIDACAEAGIGLIAMKTQGARLSFLDKVRPFEAKGWTQHQAVLKAVLDDDRIHASVSAMKGFKQLAENAAAAAAPKKLGAATRRELREYERRTRHTYCRGCEHHCVGALGRDVAVADTMRLVMYHDEYGEAEKARRLFGELPAARRDFRGLDVAAASAACPAGLDVGRVLDRAARVLAPPLAV